jgi:sigma-54 dependent transcriptional regulator, acetoin dehydrogenase operon transcriptional activator AcoR
VRAAGQAVPIWHSDCGHLGGTLWNHRWESAYLGGRMHDSAEQRRAVLRRARRALEEGAKLPADLPETIRCSWTRSRLAAAPMDRICVPYLAPDVSGERLLNAARPVLDRFAQQLAGTRVSLVLADPDGRIAGRWAADSSALRGLARVSIEEGYVLAEDLAGTNGIGTALEDLAPVIIFGAEHYAEPLQHLVCAGVPIRHPLTRRIEGVLDLACPTGEANSLLMPATLDLCAQIERELSMRAPERERVVFDTFVARSRVTNAALIALSEQYMVTNAAAADLLDPRDEACLWQQAVESLGLGRPVTRPLQLSRGSTITAQCTPILIGARPVGALIEAAVTADAGALSRRRPPARLSHGGPEQGRATRHLERELADVAGSAAVRVMIDGEPGSGRLFAARRIHELRSPGTRLGIHPAGLAQLQGTQAWLAELAGLLADENVTVVVTNLELLDESTRHGVAGLLGTQAPARLILMTRQGGSADDAYLPTDEMGDVILHVPALRQRRQDIPELAYAILAAAGVAAGISRRAMIALTSYPWPGNVAQLRRVLLAAARACRGTEIRAEHLGAEVYASAHGRRTLTRLESLERDAIADAMRESGGNKIRAAAALGMSRSTLYRRLRMYGLEPGRTVL